VLGREELQVRLSPRRADGVGKPHFLHDVGKGINGRFSDPASKTAANSANA
jgi:hypothetical protein